MIAESFPIDANDRALLTALGDAVYAVGGRVRDHFIAETFGGEIASKDADYVIVGLRIDEVLGRIAPLGRTDLVGRNFGTIKLTRPDGETLDLALARRETSTGQGHQDFAVHFGPEVTVLEDMLRRDFTINAIAVRLSDRSVVAPASAFADLAARQLRMVAPKAFIEDPLRMLRGIQFASRFAFTFEEHTAAAIRREGSLLETVESERIGEELTKLLGKSPKPSIGIELLHAFEMLGATLPELAEGIGISQNVFHVHDVFGHNVRALDIAAQIGGDLTDRFAALMHDVGKPRTIGVRPDGLGNSFHGHEAVSEVIVKDRLRALHFPAPLVQDVAALAAAHMYRTDTSDGLPLSDGAIRRFIRKIARGAEDRDLVITRVQRQFTLRHADRHAGALNDAMTDGQIAFQRRVIAQIDREPALTVKHLQIKGTDVIAAAIAAGIRPRHYRGDALVSTMLNGLLEDVMDDPGLNEASTLRAMLTKRITAA